MIRNRNATPSLGRIAVAIDSCGNVFGALRSELRARMFAAIEDEQSLQAWEAARSLVIDSAHMTTLWQAAIAIGAPTYERPTALQIVEALEAFASLDSDLTAAGAADTELT